MSERLASVDLLAALLAQQERVRQERLGVKTKIERLHVEDRKLREHEYELQNQIHDVQIRHAQFVLPTTAQPSPKNLDFLRAWVALQAA